MSFYVQHGHGKSSKIEDLAAKRAELQGVILSPGDEDKSSLRATASMVQGLGLTAILDPQTYVYSANPPGSGRCHSEHGLAFQPIHWSQDVSTVALIVDAVREANKDIGTDSLMIAPTCVQSSLTDVWTPLALQFARRAASEWGSSSTLVAVSMDESALGDWAAVADWLDVVTTIDARGFYFTVDRYRRSYPPAPWVPSRLANLMRVFYNLAVTNGYEVIWGYSDIEGLLGVASGASACASGWHYGLRDFTVGKWQPSTGRGGAATPRIHLGKLWTAVRSDEAESIYQSGLRDEIFPGWAISRFAAGDFDGWSRTEAQDQHLDLLARRSGALAQFADIADRLGAIQRSLQAAMGRFDRLAQEGIQLPPQYKSRVAAFREAIELFAAAENL